jgi:hypothetical protein
LRTANSRTFRRPDGSYQARIYAQPVNYRAGGAWKAIDTDLKRASDGRLTSTSAPAQVSLPTALDDPAKLTAGSRWVSFRLQGVDGGVTPTADGSTATYENVLDGVDATYEAKASGVKETLTLAASSAPATYRYSLDASSGLTPVLRRSGVVVFRDASGTTRFWLPAPTVQAAGAPDPTTEHVAYRLSSDNGR